MKEARNNIKSAVVFLAFGIFIFIGSFWIPATTSDILGSRFFPRLVAVFIAILSIAQIVLNLSAAKAAESVEESAESAQEKGISKPLLLTVAVLFAYYILVLNIGFTITSILYLLAQSAILMSKKDFQSKRTVIIMVITSILVPIAVNAIFWNIFSIALPAGNLFY